MNEWGDLRKRSGLSREAFAQRTGLTPGAVWRIENKGSFKPGELDKLLTVFPDGPQTVTAASQTSVKHPSGGLSVVESEPLTQDTAFIEQIARIHDVPAHMIAAGLVAKATIAETTIPPLPVLPPEISPTLLSVNDNMLRISNSEIQTFKECRRKWFLAYWRSLAPKDSQPTGARAIGDRVHRALRWMYIANDEHRLNARDALENLITLDRAKLDEEYPAGWPDELEAQFKKDADLERIMIEGYLDWLAETGADSEFELIGSEAYLEAPLPGFEKEVLLIARLDARVRRVVDGVRLFIDHKTLGDLVGPTLTLPLNEQMKMYILIEQLQHGQDEYVAGAIYNMLKRVKRTAKANPPFYKRVEVHHNPTTIANFVEQVKGTVEDILSVRDALAAGHDHHNIAYPRPTSDCRWKCQFISICALMDDGSYVEAMINAYFKVVDAYGYYVPDMIVMKKEEEVADAQ